ncbi:hypothetical protein ACB098_01G137800 [Castanea mollissima]|uniref:putative protein phosphatase 2C 55 n=1 Tax=Castanea sativa TaxID=21020 RepID=UPI003F649B7C
MIAGAFYIAKTKVNSRAQGDDAYFICGEKQTIGVADGVGGWAKLGVDPGEYARQLMINSFKAILMEPEGKINLKRVLNQAFLDTNAKGSSTACMINLKDHCLHVANVGDSGFMLIRKRGGIYKSEIQQRSFNHPFQLGKLNADVLDSVQQYKVDVEAGDILIVGTDGLFDNMFENQIKDVAEKLTEGGIDPEQVARAVAESAYQISLDKNATTPFMLASSKSKRHRSGGKVDDITVIVAYIVHD